MIKTALIIGLAGSCGNQELSKLLYKNVSQEGQVLHVIIPGRRSKKPREFFVTPGFIPGINLVEIVKTYMGLRPANTEHGRFFLGYRKGVCTRQPVGKNMFGSMPKAIASFLKLPTPERYTGHCFKQSSTSLFGEDSGGEEESVESSIEIKEEPF